MVPVAIKTEPDYYPFGGVIADRGFGRAVQPHKTAGKELDMMHGLGWADFGGRRYDPVLPQWTQPDPMAEKYCHLSPYSYCGLNPANNIDPDGKEWFITSFRDEDDILNIQIRVTGAVINTSKESFNMAEVRNAIVSQIEDVFSFSGDGYKVSMTADIRAVSSANEINETDHVFAIVDQSNFSENTTLADGSRNGLLVRIGTNVINQTLDGNNNRTIAHELGHTGGLEHPNELRNKLPITDRHTNLMTQTKYLKGGLKNKSAINLEKNQIMNIYDRYKLDKLNKDSPIYRTLTLSKNWPFITFQKNLRL